MIRAIEHVRATAVRSYVLNRGSLWCMVLRYAVVVGLCVHCHRVFVVSTGGTAVMYVCQSHDPAC